MLLENVKGLVGHDGGKTLDTIIQTLAEIGYTVDFEVMNSKYFGVPQNRERIFIVAVRNDLIEPSEWNVGKRSDVVAKGKRRIKELSVKTFNFDWPAQDQVTVRLRDILESDVDERFYLSEEKTANLVAQLENALAIKEATKQGYAVAEEGDAVNFQFPDSKTRRGRVGKQLANTLEASGINQGVVESQMLGHIDGSGHDICRRVYSEAGVAPTVPTGSSGNTTPKVAEPIIYGNLNHYGNDQMNRVYSADGISPTITVVSGGGREQKIAEEVRIHLTEDVRKIVAKSRPNDEIGISFKENGDIRPHRMDVKKSGISELNINHENNASFTVTSAHAPKIYGVTTRYRIRKLTPRECFRLQGFPDSEFDKLTASGISNSQLYKMAGNAVTVNVISALGRRLLPLIKED
jgi:DNA (cytosine-5)-methyltransferase 1